MASTTARTKARARAKFKVHFDSMILFVLHKLLTNDHELVLLRVI